MTPLCSIPATVKIEKKTMAQLLIRKVGPALKLALERRAERNNRSLEAEVCEIIRIVLDEEDKEAAIRATL
jgi:plasmid stability protein